MNQPSAALVETENDDDVLTPDEAAKFLGVSTSYLRRVTRSGEIAVLAYGVRIKRYQRRELRRFQEKHTCRPVEDKSKEK